MGGLYSSLFKPVRLVSEYVQTDEIVESKEETNLQTPNIRILKDSHLDPRSVTLGIKRTPILITTEQVPDTTTQETPKIKPYLETDIDAIDSATIRKGRRVSYTEKLFPQLTPEKTSSKLGEAAERKKPEPAIIIYDEEDDPLAGGAPEALPRGAPACTPDEDQLTGEEHPEDFNGFQELRKKLFMSPDLSKTPDIICTKRVRTPLGVVSDNVMKPWKGQEEERRKLGLENTPPFSDLTQSAPGKLLRNRPRWDQNTTFII